MNQLEYQKWIREEWGNALITPTLRERFVVTVGLGGECGEVLELLKKEVRDGKQIKPDLLLELGDLLHCLTVVARMHGMTLEEVMEANVNKLDERKKRKDIMGWTRQDDGPDAGKPT